MLPVIEALVRWGEALVSVETYREETARLAVAAGAHIVNDVWGLQSRAEHRGGRRADRRRARHHAYGPE